MTTLLIADHDNKNLDDSTLKAMTAARALGEEVHILVAGNGSADVAAQAAKITDSAKILHAEDVAYENLLAEPIADLILSLAPNYNAIIAAATTSGKNILPRVAALLDVMQISEIIEVVDPNTFKRPIYAGNAIQTVKSTQSKQVITVRTASFADTSLDGAAEIENIAATENANLSEFIENKLSDSDRPELTSAKIIISGGRGMKDGENFAMLEKVADKLGAAIGASRAAVDAGYVPNDYQVGQTGKVVAPELYIAVGISGAIQHLAGMKDSKIIVAINNDEEAPIFQVADYGIVGDLFDVVPELEAAL